MWKTRDVCQQSTVPCWAQLHANIERDAGCAFRSAHISTLHVWSTDTVITVHKPIITILQKPLTKAPIRLQATLLRTQEYRFMVTCKTGTKILQLPRLVYRTRWCHPAGRQSYDTSITPQRDETESARWPYWRKLISSQSQTADLSSYIRQYIETCDTCPSSSYKQSPETLDQHEIPGHLWEKQISSWSRVGTIWSPTTTSVNSLK